MSKRRRSPDRVHSAQRTRQARSPQPAARSPRRARTIRALAAAVVLLALGGGAAYFLLASRAPVADLQRIPDENVLLITIDTLRADALGCYGGPAATPNLDRLARDGVRFDFAHAQAVLTLPSHTSILTGEYPYQHGVRDNTGFRLKAGTPTLATMLHAHGFATGAFVSGFPLNARFGLDAGFDVYNDDFGETRGPADFLMASRNADQTLPPALDWIKAQHGHWFEWVHLFDPHAPYQPPAPFDREYAGRPYYGEVASVDRALGPLFDLLRAQPRPTLVIVTGDHGEALGDHGEATHGLFAYESTLRIPLIVAQIVPGRAEPSRGEVDEIGVRHVDILPTVLDALGMPSPSGLPGRTLLPAAERRADAPPRDSYFEAMAPMLNRGWAPLEGVIVGHDKYIDLPEPELYDLSTDPREQRNVIDEAADAETRRTLTARLREFHAELPGARRAEDPDVAARLQSLGYVSGSAPRKAQYTADDDPKRLVALDQMLHRGVDLYERHQPEQAIAIFRQVVATRPMSIAYQQLAFLLWETGDIDGAKTTLRQALAQGIKSADIDVQLATYLSETGQPRDALPMLEEVVHADGENVEALNALGITYARLGRNDEAIATFRKVLGIDAIDGMAVENLGSVYLAENRMAEAGQAFTRAVAMNPDSSRAHAGLGVVQLKTGHAAQAVASWKRAVALDRTNYDALYNLAAELVRENDASTARPFVEQFVRTAPPALYADDLRAFSRWLATH
jgi:arylsulfatase A-like enzyme/Tfp pilus assembly protein PilF